MKFAAARLAVTVVAVATSLLLYVPDACVTVKHQDEGIISRSSPLSDSLDDGVPGGVWLEWLRVATKDLQFLRQEERQTGNRAFDRDEL